MLTWFPAESRQNVEITATVTENVRANDRLTVYSTGTTTKFNAHVGVVAGTVEVEADIKVFGVIAHAEVETIPRALKVEVKVITSLKSNVRGPGEVLALCVRTVGKVEVPMRQTSVLAHLLSEQNSTNSHLVVTDQGQCHRPGV